MYTNTVLASPACQGPQTLQTIYSAASNPLNTLPFRKRQKLSTASLVEVFGGEQREEEEGKAGARKRAVTAAHCILQKNCG